jgi:cytochrome P450
MPVSITSTGVIYLALQEDVQKAAKAVEIFRANFRGAGIVVPDEEMLISEIPEPRHGRIRRIVNSAVAAHRLSRVEPMLRDLTNDLLDQAFAKGPHEMVASLITPIPTSVIAHLLGAPEKDWALWASWSDEVVGGDYPTHNKTARGDGLAGGHPEFARYIDDMIRERRERRDPPEDFITRLLQTEVDGARLTDIELRTLIAFLLISGNETTRHLLGNLLHTMATQPEIFQAIKRDRSLVINAVEESLRLDSPVSVLMREAMTDTTMRGFGIPKGTKVAFGVASANRDETLYEDPDRFRLDRPQPKGHFAFGGGPHVCPGAALARLEGRVLLDLLAERVDRIDLPKAFERVKVPVFWANGPDALPFALVS